MARQGKRKNADKTLPGLVDMSNHHTKRQSAICIKTDDPGILTPRMIYQILPDANAAKSHYVRVIDNEGEDYLDPATYFIVVDLPLAAT
jgi:hypothetical protein